MSAAHATEVPQAAAAAVPAAAAPPVRALVGDWARLYRALWHFAQGRRPALLVASGLLLGAEILRLAMPWLAGQAVDTLQRGGLAQLGQAGVLVAELLGVLLLAWCCHGAGRLLERAVAFQARSHCAATVMARLLAAPLPWHRREHPLAVSQRALQGTEALSDFGEHQYLYLQSAVQIVGPVLALWWISPSLGVVALAGMLVLAAISLGFDRVLLRLNDLKMAVQRDNAATWGSLQAHFLTVKALRLGAAAQALVRAGLDALYPPLRRIVWVNEWKWCSIDVLGNVYWCGLVVLAVWQASAEAPGQPVLLGGVFMVYEYARRTESAMAMVAASFGTLAAQVSGYRALQPLLDAPASDPLQPLCPTPWQALHWQGLTLSYPGAARPVLHGLDLQLQRGKRYALVGASGAGKTSLLMALAGLEPQVGGRLCCDDTVVDPHWLRQQATLVPHQAAFFGDSVRDNLAPGLSLPDGALVQALTVAGLHPWVTQLPQGLSAPVGQGASAWSLGQQQRLMLARATLVAQASSLVLLDEPTNHLDAATAEQVLRQLLATWSSACVVAAVHDPQLLPLFDEVIVLTEGRLTQAGGVVAAPAAMD